MDTLPRRGGLGSSSALIVAMAIASLLANNMLNKLDKLVLIN